MWENVNIWGRVKDVWKFFVSFLQFSSKPEIYQNKTLNKNRKVPLGPRGWRNTAVRSISAKQMLVSYSSDAPRKCRGVISEGEGKQGACLGDRKGQESDFTNKAREFDYSPFKGESLLYLSFH